MTIHVNDALLHLQDTAGLVLPHNLQPGAYVAPVMTEAEWNAYGWNPNPQFPADGIDAAASPKPTWAELVAADAASRLIGTRQEAIALIDIEATRRITESYGARDFEHETRIRLRGAATDAQNAERLRLHNKHDELQAWVADPARTFAELEAFDATDDSHWTDSRTEAEGSEGSGQSGG